MTQTVADLIDLWPEPSIANFGRDIGVTVEHAATIRRRGSIPVVYWEDVVDGAYTRKIKGVNFALLVALHKKKDRAA
jgi:hypothetical protein